MSAEEPKPFDKTREWYRQPGVVMRFQLNDNLGALVGKLERIDSIEYRKYVVIDQDGDQAHINIDHIVHVRGIQ